MDFEDVLPDYGVVYNEDTGMLEPVDHEQLDSEEQTKQIAVESEVIEERVVRADKRQRICNHLFQSTPMVVSISCFLFFAGNVASCAASTDDVFLSPHLSIRPGKCSPRPPKRHDESSMGRRPLQRERWRPQRPSCCYWRWRQQRSGRPPPPPSSSPREARPSCSCWSWS